MCKNIYADEKFKILDDFIDGMDEKEGSLIAILHKAQDLFGYLPKEVQLHISRKLSIPAAKVNGVVTFYSYFSEVPRGKHVINICMGTACFVRGAAELLRKTEEALGIKAGQTTEDGNISVDALRCVGACGLAPVVVVDGKVHGRVEPEQMDEILKSCR